jgi:galactan endo-1,6-beta-galactosidase
MFGDRDDIADWLFTTKTVPLSGEAVPGLGMTIARYNAGASSWNEIDGRRMVVSKTIHPFRQIDSFWLDGKNPDPDSASWDWSVDANQRALLLKARDRGAEHFELFSNSPPWWMCANDNPSGAEKDSVENLRVDQRANFAHYLAAIARRAKDHWGISFDTVAPFNEPTATFWFANGKQEGSHFPATSQVEILPLVRAALDRQGLADLPLSASDESYYDQAVAAWKIYPPEVKALVTRVNVHGYQGGKGRRDVLHDMVVRQDGKILWNSEYGDKDADGLGMARNFHLDMTYLKPTAWCYWQPIDGGIHGNGGSGWGLIDANLHKAELGKINPKAYVFAQYSRHVRPGMRILSHSDRDSVVAHDPASGKLVIAAFNGEDKPRTVAFDLSRLPGLRRATVSRWLTEPRGETRYQRLPDEKLKGTSPAWTLPPHSILTVEISRPKS